MHWEFETSFHKSRKLFFPQETFGCVHSFWILDSLVLENKSANWDENRLSEDTICNSFSPQSGALGWLAFRDLGGGALPPLVLVTVTSDVSSVELLLLLLYSSNLNYIWNKDITFIIYKFMRHKTAIFTNFCNRITN